MEQLHITLNNIKVYSYIQPHVHSFCIGLYVKAGVLYEQPGEGGITHFLEHIHFRSLGGMPQRELYGKLASMGASFNATTYKEFVYFYITAAPQHFSACADIITKLLLPLTVSKKDIAAERKVIQSEIREKDEQQSVDYFAKQEIWKGTPLCNSIGGTVTGVAGIQEDTLVAEKQRSFTARNLFFYVTGCVAQNDLADFIGKVGDHEIAQGEANRSNRAPLPDGFLNRGGKVLFRTDSGYSDILFSFDVNYSRYTKAEVTLLYDLLFSGYLSRFNMQLTETRGMVYDYNAYMEQYCNIGVMDVEYTVLPSKLVDALSLTIGLFRSAKEAISAQELDLYLPEYTQNYCMSLDKPHQLNWDMAYNNHILDKGYESMEDLPELYRAVTPQRLVEIANEIFRQENLVVAIKGPHNKKREDRARQILSTL